MGNGVGDLNIKAECNLLIQTCSIEDNHYYNSAEVTRTSTYGSTIYDNNMSVALPSKCEISFDIWSDNSSSSEHRFFVLPKSQFNTGTTQPTYALFVDIARSSMNIGKKENGTTSGLPSFDSCSIRTYHTVKFIIEGTSVKEYFDDELKATQSIEWVNNYSDYCLSMMRWSASGTSKIKNVKIKSL